MQLEEAQTQTPLRLWLKARAKDRTRIKLSWIFGILIALSARDFPWAPGMIVCFTGALIRFWACGYLEKDVNPAIGGPYAHMRNPLYFGTYVMAVGTALAARSVPVTIAISFVFGLMYHYVILEEEIKLRDLFKAPYLNYCEIVPRFFPRLFPATREELLRVNPDEARLKYNWKVARENFAHEPFLAFIGLMFAVALFGWFWSVFYPTI